MPTAFDTCHRRTYAINFQRADVWRSPFCQFSIAVWIGLIGLLASTAQAQESELTSTQWQQVIAAEQQRVQAIEQVVQSVVAVYDEDRQGGGSAVIVDSSGIAVTNHHVVAGAGVRGWGGLADGKLYPWVLIGTDPGGDVAVIQLSGRDDFPASPLANSDRVRVGQWAMAMGNPFILTEDQYPTVTLGIVSGVQRYQSGAGKNMLVYGNCIQIDSSINPGNSGGPLFNLFGQVIGINGRGSFLERGRVNVGLGYAISANQVKNFLPELLATKIIEHGTLDANFTDYEGKVRCSTLNEVSPIARAGLKLGDELLEFENQTIHSANQFTNLICTLPVGWPVRLVVKTENAAPRTIHTRLLGLPYELKAAAQAQPDGPPNPPEPPGPEKPGEGPKKDTPPAPAPTPANEKRQRELQEFLSAAANTIRDRKTNQSYAQWLLNRWRDSRPGSNQTTASDSIRWQDDLVDDEGQRGVVTTELHRDGRWRVTWQTDNQPTTIEYQGQGPKSIWRESQGNREPLTAVQAKLEPQVLQALAILAANTEHTFAEFGSPAIDGSDKSKDRTAYRLKWTDADEDWFYMWLSVASLDNESAKLELLKVSPDRDGDRQGSSVTFDQWQWQGDWWIPKQRKCVTGLDEVTEFEWRFREVVSNESNDLPHEPIDSWQPISFGHQDETGSNVDESWQPIIDSCQPRMVKVFGAGAGRVEAYATGLLVSADGLIVTTQGVFLDGQQVRVVLANGQTHTAVVLKRDRTLQLALLKINLDTPDFFPLTDSGSEQNGDWVLALSNAFKVADKDEPLSVTLGVISLQSSIDARLNERDVAYRGDLILIDAITSNPGAAGGAVVDLQGNLLGVIGRIINSSETNTRLNYAVPVKQVAQFVSGTATAGTESTVSPPTAKAELGIKLFELGGKRNPAYIDRVVAGSPAAKAGLQTDDLIVTLAGEKIGTIRDYAQALDQLVPGQETMIVVKRGTEVLRIPITPVERVP